MVCDIWWAMDHRVATVSLKLLSWLTISAVNMPGSLAFHITFLPLSGFWLSQIIILTKLSTIISGTYSILYANVQMWADMKSSRFCTYYKASVAFLSSAVKRQPCSLPPPASTWGETGGLEALKPLWIKRIDFKDKLIYTQLLTSGMLMWGC